jgi:hypothetical protein
VAVSVTCDVCGAKVGAAGFKVVGAGDVPLEAGDVRGDYCSAFCITRALSRAGSRRPAFGETREVLDRLASQRDLDERFMRGEYGKVPCASPLRVAS